MLYVVAATQCLDNGRCAGKQSVYLEISHVLWYLQLQRRLCLWNGGDDFEFKKPPIPFPISLFEFRLLLPCGSDVLVTFIEHTAQENSKYPKLIF